MDLYNLLWNGTNTANAQTALNRTADMLTVMSNRFSDYPFKNEKYGHYTFGFGGGMEHNTFSGMGTTTYDATNDWSVIAHELGHQWFGAAVTCGSWRDVTCGSWRDIWVNEGFARYSEVVYLEGKANGNGITTTPTAHRASFKSLHIGLLLNPMPALQKQNQFTRPIPAQWGPFLALRFIFTKEAPCLLVCLEKPWAIANSSRHCKTIKQILRCNIKMHLPMM